MNDCPPYRPFRGAEPPHFVDRPDDEDMGAAGLTTTTLDAYRHGPSDPRFHRLVLSEPGMGKTALLRAVGRQAAVQLNWAVASHRCRPKERVLGTMTAEILARMHAQWRDHRAALAQEVLVPRTGDAWALRGRAAHPAGATRAARPVPASPAPDGPAPDGPAPDAASGVASSLAPVPHYLSGGEASWAELRRVLQLAGCFAQRLSRGLLLIFDDADCLGGGQVESLGHLARSLSRDGLPVALLLSGGDELQERFCRVGNFSGVLWATRLEWFDDDDASEALVVPAADRGVDFQHQAIERARHAARGSPLELQRLGFAAWTAAPDREAVTVADVDHAIAMVAPPATMVS